MVMDKAKVMEGYWAFDGAIKNSPIEPPNIKDYNPYPEYTDDWKAFIAGWGSAEDRWMNN